MAILSPLQLVPPHAPKSIGNSDGSPVIPDNKHHKRKKTKIFGLAPCRRRSGQGSSLRSQLCPLKESTARAVATQCSMVIPNKRFFGKKTKAFGLDISAAGQAG